MSISDTLTALSNRNVAAMPKATVMVNGQPTQAEVDPDGLHVWINVRGRRLRVPRGKHSLSANLSTGTVTPIRPEVVAQPEPDEDLIMAQKVRRVREMAKNKPLPKSERASSLIAAQRLTARQNHEAVWSNARSQALAEWAKLPLSQRVREEDVPGLVELAMTEVLADRDLRAAYRMAADAADAMDGVVQDEPAAPMMDEPVDPAPVAPLVEPSIADLIAQIDAEVARQQEDAVTAPVVDLPQPTPAPQRATERATSTEPVAPQSVWTGQLSVGMVAANVRLYPRHTDQHGSEVHRAHADCGGGRVGQRWECKACRVSVETVDLGRLVDGVHVTADEWSRLDAEALKDITITEFVPAADLDLPVLAETTYAVGAGQNGERALVALREALRAEGRAGIGRIVLRRVERLVALHVAGGELRLSVLRWADQIKPAAELPAVEVSDVELDQARALVAGMSGKFTHSEHADTRQARIAELLSSKS